MSDDFYCDEVFSGKTTVEKVFETDRVLAYHHTRPFWPVHIVVVPKQHVDSLLTVENDLLLELMDVAKKVAASVLDEHGAVRVLTNLGEYQDSKHLHFHVLSGESLGTQAPPACG
ncbi:MAG: HIT domain-containing protein [bacterium]|nr:HIT domain-containing protein [bacterium]